MLSLVLLVLGLRRTTAVPTTPQYDATHPDANPGPLGNKHFASEKHGCGPHCCNNNGPNPPPATVLTPPGEPGCAENLKSELEGMDRVALKKRAADHGLTTAIGDVEEKKPLVEMIMGKELHIAELPMAAENWGLTAVHLADFSKASGDRPFNNWDRALAIRLPQDGTFGIFTPGCVVMRERLKTHMQCKRRDEKIDVLSGTHADTVQDNNIKIKPSSRGEENMKRITELGAPSSAATKHVYYFEQSALSFAKKAGSKQVNGDPVAAQGTTHLFGTMSDVEYQQWMDKILDHIPNGTIVDIGAGMGKFLAMASFSDKRRWTRLIGFEPAPTSVCTGWRMFPTVELHIDDASALSCVEDGIADAVVSIGVLEYFSPLEYLCRMMLESARVLKPGGVAFHAWIIPVGSAKVYDKLGINKEFWGTNAQPLPACKADIGAQFDTVKVTGENHGGYEVKLTKTSSS